MTPAIAGVATTLGEFPPERLGAVLPHEHIFITNMEHRRNRAEGSGQDEQEESAAIASLRTLATTGVALLVDMTVLGMGRDPARVMRVSQAAGLPVAFATGAYVLDTLPQHALPPASGRLGVLRALERLMLEEATVGVAGTGVRAAVIKATTDEAGLTRDAAEVLRVAARVHLATGVPLATHAHAGSRGGISQLDVLEREGVDPRRVVIGHVGDTRDPGYARAMLARGAYVGLDRFGMDAVLPLGDRIQMVIKLCEDGFADKLLLSTDAACCNDHLTPRGLRLMGRNWSHSALLTSVVPGLRAAGLTDREVSRLIEGNPRRFLTGADADAYR